MFQCYKPTASSGKSTRTVDCHILRVGTVVHSNSSIWAGGEACLRPSTVDVVQPDLSSARPKPAEEFKNFNSAKNKWPGVHILHTCLFSS